MDDIFGNSQSWNEYLDLLNQYDLLYDSATADIDYPFLDCDAVLNRIMDTQPACYKPLLDPSSTPAHITSESASSPLQKIESSAMSQSILCYSSQVSLEMIDFGHSSEAVFASANEKECQTQVSQADTHYSSNKTTYMLECSQSHEQPNYIEVIPTSFSHSTISVSVQDHMTANFSSAPCHQVSFIINEAEENKEVPATTMLDINTVAQRERHHKRTSKLRRSHLRKRRKLELLRKDLNELQRENANLQRICEDLRNSSSHHQAMWDTQFKLMQEQAFIVTDPNVADNGIVYASQAFLQMTGYAREQILGRSCRFLQGPRTCPSKIDELRKAIEQGEEWTGTIINYKADNTPFWNRLYVAALRNNNNEIVNYVGVAVEVELPDSDDPEYEQALAHVEGS